MLRQAARALSGAVPRLAAVTEVSAPRLRVQEALACSLQPHRGIPVRAASWGDGRAFATESSKGEGEKDEAQRAEQAEGEGTSTTDEMTLEQLKEKLGKSEQDLAEQAKQVSHVGEHSCTPAPAHAARPPAARAISPLQRRAGPMEMRGDAPQARRPGHLPLLTGGQI